MNKSLLTTVIVGALCFGCGFYAEMRLQEATWSHLATKANEERYSELMYVVHYMAAPLTDTESNRFSTPASREEYRLRCKELVRLLDARMDRKKLEELLSSNPAGADFLKDYDKSRAVIMEDKAAK